MASNVLQFPPQPANENPGDAPPFDPADAAHVRAWRTLWLLANEELRQRMIGRR